MAKKTNPKIIGGFVVGATALVIVGLLAFGGGQFLQAKEKFVMYFQGSLSGLSVGSPVTFRGVQVGTVTGIVIQYDVDKQELHIPVYVALEADKFQITSGTRDPNKNIAELIDRGLRGQLQTVSLVTGQSDINFDLYPGTPILTVANDSGLMQLPSLPSDIDLLKANVTGLLAKLSKLPLDEISQQLLDTVQSANRLLKNADIAATGATGLIANLNGQVKPLSESILGTTGEAKDVLKEAQDRLELRDGEPMQNLNLTLAGAHKLVDSVNHMLPQFFGPAVQLLAKTGTAVDYADALLLTAQRTLAPGSPITFEAVATLRELRNAAAAIKVLAEYLQRNPNALLTGNH
jgi:paraquat-inducible protein B